MEGDVFARRAGVGLARFEIVQRSGESAIERGAAATEVLNPGLLQRKFVQIPAMHLPDVFTASVERDQSSLQPLLGAPSLCFRLGLWAGSKFIIAGRNAG
jgi:hypothetical protein